MTGIPSPAQLVRELTVRQVREAGYRLTVHALDRAIEMRVPGRLLARILREGSSWPVSTFDQSDAGTMRHLSEPETERWAAITATDEPERVITVVFWAPEGRVRRLGARCEPERGDTVG